MSTLTQATEAFAERELVLVGDDQAETIFVACAADRIDASRLERLHDLGRGMVFLGLAEEIAERLALPDPWNDATGRRGVGLTAPIDATAGIAGGWSLRDRALTMRVAADPSSRPSDVTIPGHVYTALIEERPGSGAAAAIELARLSDGAPAVALSAVVDRDGLAASVRDAPLSRLRLASPAELHSARIARHAAEMAVSCALPTRGGMFRALGYGPAAGEPATIALVHGEPATRALPLVHVHVACLFGDAFGSLLCDCRRQLDSAVDAIARDGAGVIIYAKPEQQAPAMCAHGEPVDAVLVAGLLRAAGVHRLRLLNGAHEAPLREELLRSGLELAG
jgi:3,4-dihydroxy 2-butanone 4-phosphate synthase / GTP cyclohydrolase II